jgi:predicted TIM-barrel fold metal-dependent hydrolase
VRDGYRVIDADTHVVPSLEILLGHAEEEMRSRADALRPYMRETRSPPGRGHPAGSWTNLRIRPIPYSRVAGQKLDVAREKTGGGNRGALEGRVENIAKRSPTEGVQHANAMGRVGDMDREGVDVDLIIPGTWASAVTALDAPLAVGLYRAYHNYMRDFCAAAPERLVGLLLAPAADIAWAVREVKDRGKERWVSAVWPVLPEGYPIDDPDLEPLWAAMNEYHLPIIHHSFFYEPPYFPGYRDIWGNIAVARAAAHPWGAQRLLAYVVLSGILDRHPNIRLGFSETGHGWLPYWMLRLDSQVDYIKDAAPPLKHRPSDYVRMGRIFCAIEMHEGPEMTKAVIDILGDGCLMYASDFPHPECDWPRSVDNVIAWRDSIGEGALRKLLAGNAERYLRLS